MTVRPGGEARWVVRVGVETPNGRRQVVRRVTGPRSKAERVEAELLAGLRDGSIEPRPVRVGPRRPPVPFEVLDVDEPRLPLRDLERVLGDPTDRDLAEVLGATRHHVARWRAEGLSLVVADRLAVEVLGCHPSGVWGNDWWRAAAA